MGLIGGLGFSLVFVTSVIILLRWFDKRLALAMGIASSGTGIGAFVFAPLTQLLLDRFGLKITVVSVTSRGEGSPALKGVFPVL